MAPYCVSVQMLSMHDGHELPAPVAALLRDRPELKLLGPELQRLRQGGVAEAPLTGEVRLFGSGVLAVREDWSPDARVLQPIHAQPKIHDREYFTDVELHTVTGYQSRFCQLRALFTYGRRTRSTHWCATTVVTRT